MYTHTYMLTSEWVGIRKPCIKKLPAVKTNWKLAILVNLLLKQTGLAIMKSFLLYHSFCHQELLPILRNLGIRSVQSSEWSGAPINKSSNPSPFRSANCWKNNKRPMGHIARLRNEFKSINTFAIKLWLIWRGEHQSSPFS